MGKIKALKQSKAIQIIEWHGKTFLIIKIWKFLIEINLSIKMVR